MIQNLEKAFYALNALAVDAARHIEKFDPANRDLRMIHMSDVGHLSHLILLSQWSRASEVRSPTRRVITYQEFTDRSILDPVQRFAELEGLGDDEEFKRLQTYLGQMQTRAAACVIARTKLLALSEPDVYCTLLREVNEEDNKEQPNFAKIFKTVLRMPRLPG